MKNLYELYNAMKSGELDGQDWTSLPTFGPEVADTYEVWSWDETKMIVGSCKADLTIVDRNDINEPTREQDETELAIMRGLELRGRVIVDSEGEVPLRLTLGQMCFGSDEAATRAFHRLITAYDGGNQ